jgi:hypothetical protein
MEFCDINRIINYLSQFIILNTGDILKHKKQSSFRESRKIYVRSSLGGDISSIAIQFLKFINMQMGTGSYWWRRGECDLWS